MGRVFGLGFGKGKMMTNKFTSGPLRVVIDGTCSGASPEIIQDCVDPETGETWERELAQLETSHVETEAARNSDEMPGNYKEKPHRFELTPEGEESIANAVLWASAPELLEALQNCLEWMESADVWGDFGNWKSDFDSVFNVGCKAIAKATGEKP